MEEENIGEVLSEFNKSNFKNAYNLGVKLKENNKNKLLLNILTISSFKIEKYLEAIKYGHQLLKTLDEKDGINILNILGTSYSILKDYQSGNKYLKKYLLHDPQNIPIKYNLGLNLFKQKKYKEAELYLQNLILDKNEFRDSELIYGIIQSELKEYESAIIIFRNIINKKKYLSDTYFNLGITYQKKEDFLRSIKYFKKAIKANNKQDQYFNSLGVSYQKLFKYDMAIKAYENSIKLNKQNSKSYNNLGLLLKKNGEFQEALNNYTMALKYDPNNSDILYNKSICLLENGNFKEGFKFYKWRQNGKYINSDIFSLDEIENKKILIKCDQGLGDIILMSRFVNKLSNYKAKVFFQIPESMEYLLKGLDRRIIFLIKNISNYKFDHICTLGDLFEIFNINAKNIPIEDPYLTIENKWIEKWKNQIDKRKFNIGICWQGKTGSVVDEGRSFKLKYFENISKIKNVNLISLQKNEGLDQIKEFTKKNKLVDFNDTLDKEAKFMDTAGLMKNLDLVISSDTSIAHLGGALGVKVWTLVQKYPFWYWNTKNQNSLWYKSVKIFKQEENHNWKKLFLNLEDKLKEII